MILTRDIQVLKAGAETAKALAREGAALTLKQLSLVVNYSYSTIRAQAKREGFPMQDHKVMLADYREWRRRQVGLSPTPDTSARRPRSAVGKSLKFHGSHD